MEQIILIFTIVMILTIKLIRDYYKKNKKENKEVVIDNYITLITYNSYDDLSNILDNLKILGLQVVISHINNKVIVDTLLDEVKLTSKEYSYYNAREGMSYPYFEIYILYNNKQYNIKDDKINIIKKINDYFYSKHNLKLDLLYFDNIKERLNRKDIYYFLSINNHKFYTSDKTLFTINEIIEN